MQIFFKLIIFFQFFYSILWISREVSWLKKKRLGMLILSMNINWALARLSAIIFSTYCRSHNILSKEILIDWEINYHYSNSYFFLILLKLWQSVCPNNCIATLVFCKDFFYYYYFLFSLEFCSKVQIWLSCWKKIMYLYFAGEK